jgi:hypothetical protein
MGGPVLVIPPNAQRALLKYQRSNQRVDRWFVTYIRVLNGINEHATRWKGWRSTIWGR